MFSFAGTVNGGPGADTIVTQRMTANAIGTFRVGTVVKYNAGGIVEAAATGATTFFGVVAATKVVANVATDKVEVIVNPDAVWAVTDANVRNPGDTLNLGADARSVAAGTADFEVQWYSTAAQPTYVSFQRTKRAAKLS